MTTPNQEAKKYQMEVTNLPTGAQIAYLCLSKSTNYMFMGTTGAKNPGMIRCYKYPFTKDAVAIVACFVCEAVDNFAINMSSYL